MASSSCSTTITGVADVAEVDEGFEKPGIVALVQADGRLIEDVEYAGEARTDLRGEPDALAFAAGERARDARQVEIFEAHIHQEFQAGLDFLQDAGGDFALLGASAWVRDR